MSADEHFCESRGHFSPSSALCRRSTRRTSLGILTSSSFKPSVAIEESACWKHFFSSIVSEQLVLSGVWGTPGGWSVFKQDLSSQTLSVVLFAKTHPASGSGWIPVGVSSTYKRLSWSRNKTHALYEFQLMRSQPNDLRNSDIPSVMNHYSPHKLRVLLHYRRRRCCCIRRWGSAKWVSVSLFWWVILQAKNLFCTPWVLDPMGIL